jgi:hypothetical protein
MNANIIDYVAWAVVLGVTMYILYSRMKKYDGRELNIFYAEVIGGMMAAFFILALLKTGYAYNKDTQKCETQRFGYWKYSSSDDCLNNEKKDTITGLGYF